MGAITIDTNVIQEIMINYKTYIPLYQEMYGKINF